MKSHECAVVSRTSIPFFKATKDRVVDSRVTNSSDDISELASQILRGLEAGGGELVIQDPDQQVRV